VTARRLRTHGGQRQGRKKLPPFLGAKKEVLEMEKKN
jgi:hypothetical protein